MSDSLTEFLNRLSDDERNFISKLDYGDRSEEHRQALDLVIKNGGTIDPSTQSWFPYEAIELGKNWLQDGHEREFVACAAIVLHNIIQGTDQSNDVDIGLQVVLQHFATLTEVHKQFLQPLLDAAIDASN